ncbi:hypothetical protein T08_6136 [Trichinella sp. T8]|nr:hypothetical protein T08_6136 [Trichinella sp. T8]
MAIEYIRTIEQQLDTHKESKKYGIAIHPRSLVVRDGI